MPALHKNRVKMTVSGTPGTGTVTLGSASSGHQSFATAYGANATVDVLFEDGTAWEVARNCTYTHSGTTVTRGTLEESSTGSAISLTSAATASVIATAGNGNLIEALLQGVTPGGRLTLESGVPVSTTDQTSKTNVYYTPYVHNMIVLWDGADWCPTTFTEKTLALGTLTSGKPYDVFGYLSAGALVLESLAWTNDTTRATAVTLQDGRYCKSGDKTRLLLGSFYTTSTTTTEDSDANKYVSNVYNTVLRYFFKTDGTSHTYASAAFRKWNGGTATDANFITSLSQNITITAQMDIGSSGQGLCSPYFDGAVGTISAIGASVAGSGWFNASAPQPAAAGKHTISVAEYSLSSTSFFNATASGSFQC